MHQGFWPQRLHYCPPSAIACAMVFATVPAIHNHFSNYFHAPAINTGNAQYEAGKPKTFSATKHMISCSVIGASRVTRTSRSSRSTWYSLA